MLDVKNEYISKKIEKKYIKKNYKKNDHHDRVYQYSDKYIISHEQGQLHGAIVWFKKELQQEQQEEQQEEQQDILFTGIPVNKLVANVVVSTMAMIRSCK